MNAKQQVAELLKTIYDAGDVNAMTIWKGYDAMTGQTGWQDGTAPVVNTEHQARAAAFAARGEMGRHTG